MVAAATTRRARSRPQGLARYALLLVALSASARKAAAAALSLSPRPASKPRIEIRVQDYSFREGPSERPVIEVEAKDMQGSEIYDAILAMAFDNSLEDSEQDRAEQLSHQDALLLVLLVLCGVRLLLYGVASCWSLLRRCLGIDAKDSRAVPPAAAKTLDDDNTDGISDSESQQRERPQQQYQHADLHAHWLHEEPLSAESSSELVSAEEELLGRPSALIRLCHLQFLVLAEKLKQELRDASSERVGETIASLPANLLYKDDVQLADIVRVLEQIPLTEHGLSTERIERQMAAIRHDLVANSTNSTGAWSRLQELYASFQSIQRTIQRRKRRSRRAASLDETTTATTTTTTMATSASDRVHTRNRERSSTSETAAADVQYADDVLGELKRVALTLPQGFTADMFASLGKAILAQTTDSRRIAGDADEDEYKTKQE